MGVDDGKQVNIPAPPTFKLKGRWLGEDPPIESGGPSRERGDVEASAKADSSNYQPRKASAYTKASVP
jgi:hypothetical protein